jgi:hypothetical protein
MIRLDAGARSFAVEDRDEVVGFAEARRGGPIQRIFNDRRRIVVTGANFWAEGGVKAGKM